MIQPRLYVIRPDDAANDWRTARLVIDGVRQLAKQGVAEGKPVSVTIAEWEPSRSDAQNRLSHMWYAERAEHFGVTPEHDHRYCKLEYGCPILIAADKEFASVYRQAIEPIDYESRLLAMKYLPVTRIMSVKKMAEYLTTVERESLMQGIPLTHPAMIYAEAMGR